MQRQNNQHSGQQHRPCSPSVRHGSAQPRATAHSRALPRRLTKGLCRMHSTCLATEGKVPKPTHGRAQPRRLIKDFEREARTDGLPAEDLAARKRLLVAELNSHITAKKEAAGALDARRELVADGRVNRAGAEIAPSSARPTIPSPHESLGASASMKHHGRCSAAPVTVARLVAGGRHQSWHESCAH